MTTHATAFAILTQHQKLLVLSAYARELTIQARGGYVAGEEGLSDPVLLRRINEKQHRISGAVFELLQDANSRFADAVVIDALCGSAEGDPIRIGFRSSFRRAWRIALGWDLAEAVGE